MGNRGGEAAQEAPAFAFYGDDSGERRSWLAAGVTSTALYLALTAAVVVVGGATKQAIEEKAVDLTFVEKIAKPEPPPPPAPAPQPVPEVKPQAPAAAAPVIRPDQKIRKLDKPPPPKEMLAPKDMPTEAAREADPSQDKGIAVYGDGGAGDPAGLEGGVAKGGVVGGQVGGAIALPEDATAPVPSKANEVPAYPQEARAIGKTGMVVLKVVVLADGSVGDVQVMRGEEPFVGAAIAAVKKWKYEPARYQGQPITVYRIIQIPFKLTA